MRTPQGLPFAFATHSPARPSIVSTRVRASGGCMKRSLLFFIAVSLSAAAAQATTITYGAILNGSNEAPSNASPGTGFARVTYDDVLHTLEVQVSFSGLIGTTTASHIHCCTAVAETGTAGVATTTPT